MWSMMADALFALLAFLIVYHHLLYPLLLKKLSRRKHSPAPDSPQRQYREQAGDSDLPDITLIIPAYNEAASIADKIRNLASQDYPSAHFNVEILCDGCTDNTADLARLAHAEPECRWLPLTIRAFSTNRGKIAVINEAIQRVKTPIVAFSDVS
ncbi:MAG: glycosyltransferase, partial [Plesiomonas shigelloides]